MSGSVVSIKDYFLTETHLRESLKTQKNPSLLVRSTPDSFGEKGRDEANKKTVFRHALNDRKSRFSLFAESA